MASILKVDALQGVTSAGDITVTSEGGAATQSLQQGLSKAWVNFNGTGTIVARDSLNLSSLDDNGTGYYSQNYSSSFASTNYAGAANVNENSANGINRCMAIYPNTSSKTNSSVWATSNTTQYDEDFLFIVMHGDLA